MLSRRWAANAQTERDRCKAKQGRRGKTALTCGSWSYSSTVLGSRPELEKIYLVTISATCYFIIEADATVVVPYIP
jgi:hypothetical protein